MARQNLRRKTITKEILEAMEPNLYDGDCVQWMRVEKALSKFNMEELGAMWCLVTNVRRPSDVK